MEVQHHHHQQSRADKYWQDSPSHQYDRNLNFAAIGSEDDDYASFNGKSGKSGGAGSNSKASRDPQSHRIIEKRRRDRMNNCLADLSRLLPPACMKKGRGRIEKTEIIEMTIKHLKHLQVHACKEMENCEIALQMEQSGLSKSDQYRSGFLECISETMEFVSQHNLPPGAGDDFAARLFAYLHSQCDKFTRAASDGNVSDPGGDAQPLISDPAPRKLGLREEDVPHPTSSPSGHLEDRFHGGNKDAQDRVHSMFNYLGGSENPCSMRHVNRRPSSSGHESDEANNMSNRSDQATRNSGTPSPGEGSGSSPRTCTDMDNSSSHSGGSAHSSSSMSSSQLRKILLSNGEESSMTTSASTARTKSCSSASSGGSERRSSMSSQQHHDESAYKKFKTNIQQRFTADLEHEIPQPSSCLLTPTSMTGSTESQQERISSEPPLKRKISDYEERHCIRDGSLLPPSPTSTGRSSSSVDTQLERNPLDKHLESVVVGQPLPMPVMEAQGSSENVPIFALHPKGSFYVPMSIEMAMIRSHFQLNTDSASPLLHPVTISVNFCHPLRVLAATDILKVIGPTVNQQPRAAQEPPMPAMISRPISSPPPLQRTSMPEMDEAGSRRFHLRAARAVLREEYVNYQQHQQPVLEAAAGTFRTREYHQYPMVRPGHHAQHPHFGGTVAVATAVAPATHSSRWSHLMAKRTHTP